MAQSAENPKGLFIATDSHGTLLDGVTDVSTEDVYGVGTKRVEGDKTYRWVQNKGGASLAVGYVVCYSSAQGEAFHEKVYKAATGEKLNHKAGLALGTVAADSYCWILIDGYSSALNVLASDTAYAVGDLIEAGNGLWYGSVYQADSLAAETCASNATVCGKLPCDGVIIAAASLDTASASAATTIAAWVRCLHV